MKKILLAIAIIFTASQAQANTYSYCVAVGSLAQATMSMRQAGVPFEAAYDPNEVPRINAMLIDAYSRHQFVTERFRAEATQSFSMEYFAKCLDGEI